MKEHTHSDWQEDRWTEADEKLKRAIDEIKVTNPDFWEFPKDQYGESFADTMTKQGASRRTRGKTARHSALRIACILLLFFTIVTGAVVWVNSEPASALKFRIEQKYYEIKNGFFSTDAEYEANNEGSISVEYTSMEEIPKAKRFLPELQVPEYIPDGYELALLEVAKKSDGSYEIYYQFIGNGSDYFFINVIKKTERDSDAVTFGGATSLEVEGLEIVLWEDQMTGICGGNATIADVVIQVTGNISEDELVEVITNIQ